MSQISLQNLKKSFGETQVIHDLSIDVKDGELIVIVCLLYTSDAADE